jgi:hypothetical protein
MRPVCGCHLRTRRTECGPPKVAWRSLRWRSPIVATHFTLAAMCNPVEYSWRSPTTPFGTIQTSKFQIIRRKLENTHAICRRRTKRRTKRRHPLPVHKARLIIRRKLWHSKKILPLKDFLLCLDFPGVVPLRIVFCIIF